ncbi:MAG: tetratricopeptide repeat protein [Saprospiraceae bacterium]|nr:tetratricopeptide repeat protein [Saprospiraceae bacterium]
MRSNKEQKSKKERPEYQVTTAPVKPVNKIYGLGYREIGLLFILILTTFIVYKSGFDNKFVNWDDQVYVEEQAMVLNKEYSKLWKTPVSLNYHPVTMISLAIQVPNDIKKLNPKPFIRLNILIHIFNSLLVFFLIWMIDDKKWFTAVMTSAIFALHPMHVESVVWISERKDVLYTFFFLLSCISYWKYLMTDKKKWIFLTFILFVLSVLSKAMAVVLPLVLLLMDYWKGKKLTDVRVMAEKIPFLAVSVFFGLMAVSVQSGGDFGGLLTLYGEKTKAVAAPETFTLLERFQFATYGFSNYIGMFFNPAEICAYYPYPEGNKLTGWQGFIYPLSFLAIVGVTLWSVFKTKIFAFGIGFYFLTVALVLQFMSVGLAIMADRYTYIPYIGLAFMISYSIEKWAFGHSTIVKNISLGLVFVFLVFLAFKTKSQVEVWQDSESLWTQVLQYYPKEDLALANRGNYRGKTGNIGGAMTDFELAVADGCVRADVYEGLGNSYGTMSEQQPDKKEAYVAKAIEMYNKAIELQPSNGQVRYNLGVAQLQTSPSSSVIAFSEALRLMPYKETTILPVLGLSQLNAGQYPDAIQTLTKAINAGNKTDAVFYHRGLAHLGTGNKDAAKADFNQALAINPGNKEVMARLGGL